MTNFDCALSDSLIRPFDAAPVLSIVVPTYNRPEELQVAVRSIARQITGDLTGKVEVLITDNSCRADVGDVIRALAAEFPCVSYMLHQNNEGGGFQIYAAPFRARGQWTWVFGDDDAVTDDALAYVVGILETDAPQFLTLNRQVLNRAFDQVLTATKHNLPDMKFDTLWDFLDLFGFDQVSFWSSQIYRTQTVRAVDPDLYLASPCYYSQMAYYLEGFHDKTAYYGSRPVVLHRWEAGDQAVHANNFHHLATHLPIILDAVIRRAGIDRPDLFEGISGRRSILTGHERAVTFVDNILQNLWRSVAVGTIIPQAEWDALFAMLPQWRPERAEQMDMVKQAYDAVTGLTQEFETEVATVKGFVAGRTGFTEEEVTLVRQMQAKVLSMEGHINDSRKTALEISQIFN